MKCPRCTGPVGEGEEVILKGEECDALEGFHPVTEHHWWCGACADKARTWPEYLPDAATASEWLSEASRENRARRRQA